MSDARVRAVVRAPDPVLSRAAEKVDPADPLVYVALSVTYSLA